MRKVIGIGETILDVIFEGSQPTRAVPGGSTFNSMVSLGRLGATALFVSELGNDRVGEMIRSFMQANHISTEYIDIYSNGKSPLSLAFLDEQHNAQYQFYKSYPEERLNITFPQIEKDDLVVYGSYYALDPALRPKVKELLEYAHRQRAILYYDPNFRPAHLHELQDVMPAVLENISLADIVRGSDEDFLNLFNQRDLDKVYAEQIRPRCPIFLATLGAKGVDCRLPERLYHSDTPSIRPLSTIGAGDNFNAGILYGLLKYEIRKDELNHLSGEQWQQIVRCGINLATEVCQSYENYISEAYACNYHL